jgi:type VI secretion system protein ImpF
MASARSREILRPSVLDRLLEGYGTRSPSDGDGIGLRELKRAVARDLEWLLNTRCWLPSMPEELPEARESLLTYGIPDLSPYSWISTTDAEQVCRLMEQAIRAFEPRLLPRSVKVLFVPSDSVDDFAMRFHIDAVLHVDPITEPVRFDTNIDYETGVVDVKGEG